MNKILSIFAIALTVSTAAFGQNVSQAIRELQSAKNDIVAVKSLTSNYEVVRKLNDALAKIDNSIYQLNSNNNGGGNNPIVKNDWEIFVDTKNDRIQNCYTYVGAINTYYLKVNGVRVKTFSVTDSNYYRHIANEVKHYIRIGVCYYR